MAEPDLHTKLRSAIEERLALAELAGRGWPSIIGIVEGDPPFVAPDQITEHIAANDPAFVIRACRADLERLERHTPRRWTTDDTYVMPLCGCSVADNDPKRGCPEVRSLAEVYEVAL